MTIKLRLVLYLMLLGTSPFISPAPVRLQERRRDGASHWGICRDLETPGRYLETFIVGSWDEHLRQHERMTRADSSIEESLRGYVRGEPAARHLLYL